MRKWLILLTLFLTSCGSFAVNQLDQGLGSEKPVQYLYDHITVEIQPTTQVGVVNSQLVTFRERLHEYRICRSDRINFIVKNPVEAPVELWTRSAVMAFMRAHRTLYDLRPDDRHLIVYMSVLPGKYPDTDSNIIGMAFGNQHMALFNNFDHYVLLHEMGHTIGLVDRDHREGEPVNPERPNHCNVRECVMFWIVDKNGRFDDRCLKDLERMIAEAN